MQLFYCLWLVLSVAASIVEAVPRRLNPQCRSNVCDDRPECPRTSCACIFPSRMDCAVYYQCMNGKPFQYKCSPGLLFNSETLSCDYSHNVDCGFNTNYTSSTAALNTTTAAPLTTTVTAKIKSTTGITEEEITTSDTSTAVASTTSEGTTTEVTEKISTTDETTTEAATSRPSSVSASTDKEITTTEKVTTLQTETTKVSTSKATTAETTIDTTTEASTPSTTEKHTTVKTTLKVPTTTTPVAETTTAEVTESDTDTWTTKAPSTTHFESSTTVTEQFTTEVLTTSSIFTTTKESPSTSKYPLVTNSSVISTESEDVSTSNPSSSEFLCPTRFGLFPDPKSCNRFYHCSHWTPYHKWCPSNLHFNPWLKVCDWPYRAGCDSSTPNVTGTPTPQPDTVTSTPKPNKTSEACDCEYCELPVPGDCSAYVLCIDHVATLMQCAQDLFFNPMTGTCDLRENVVCIEDNILCPESSGRFLVEGSCSYFLECHNGIKTLKKCPEGLQFNQSSEMCSWLGSCAGGLPDNQPAPGIIADFAPCESCDYCYKPFGEDCSHYVKCVHGYAIEGRCAAGLFFNPDTQMCDHSYNVQCPVPEPRIECPERFGYFPYPGDCGTYLHCINGRAELKQCPGVLHFDPLKKHCDWPWTAGCNESDSRPTPVPDVETSDCDCDCCLKPAGTDCRSFILCINHVGFKRSCSSGLHFNPHTENCDFAENVECSTNPDIPGYQCPEYQGLFAHPEDCEKFIHCAHGFPHVKDCPSNLHFNPTFKVCDWPYSAGCQGIPPSEPPSIDNDLPCDVCDSCFIPDESDCASYIYCRNGTGHKLRCTENLVFNPNLETCDLQSNVKCPNQPTSHCPSPDGLFAAKDCSQFIHCSNGIAYLKDCPDGLHFNPQILVCDWPENVKCGETPVLPTLPPLPDDDNDIFNRTCNCDCCFLPHEKDCSKYILCLDGLIHVGQCSRGLLFNPVLQTCDFAERVTCGDTSPLCPEPNGLFPNGEQCSSYLICSNGIAHLEYCQNGKHFSAENKQCLDPCKAECDRSYNCSVKPDIVTPNPGKSICLDLDGFYPVANDCTSFYVCSGGQPQVVKCPHGLHYNPDVEVCEEPCNAKCDKNIHCESPSPSTSSTTVVPSSTTLSPYCLEKDGLFGNKNNCSLFYQCSGGRAYVVACPPGLHFSDERKVCDYPCAAKCDSSIDCETPSPSTSTTSTAIPSSTTLSPYCPEKDGMFGNRNNCSSFYQCSEGRAYLVACPPGLHFSDGNKVCDYPCAAKCDPSIDCESSSPSTPTTQVIPLSTTMSPYCLEKDGLFGNRNNCSSFYLCSGGKAHLVACPPGLHFSVEHKVCEYPCAAKCNSSINCNPSTPSSTTLVSSTTTLSPHCLESNGMFPNTEDCTSFYQCSEGRAYLVLCPSGLHFSDEHKVCDYPCDAKCNATIDCSPSSTASTAPSTTTLSPHCYEKDGLFPNKDDCTSFYECSSGRAYLKRCPSGLHFSSRHRVCEYPCEAKCNVSLDCSTTTPRAVSSTPSPHCPTPNGIHPVPGVCTAFYLCSNGKEYLISCPPGLHFSEEHEICEDPCLALCNTSVDCSSSTASTAPSTTTLSPHCYEKDGIFPNKDDCTSFYECSSGRAYLKRCPSGLHFSAAHKACEYPCEAKCNTSVDCSTTTPQVISSTPSPHCPTANGIHPVPGDCTSFYLCSNGKEYLIPCPPGLHFSEQHEICEDPCIALCNTSSDCSSSTASTAPSTTTLSPHCYEKDGIFPNKDDCTSFYECSRGRAYLKRCPSGLHFSTAHKACEYPCEAKCNISLDCSTTTPQVISSTPSPHCPTANGIHPVPGDCTSFYLCSNGKEYLIPCPPGLHFSEQHEICEDPCIALCNTSADCRTSVKPSSSTPPTWTPECKEPDGLFPNPDDCETFYQCSNGQSQLIRCPSGLHFSLDDSACERPCVAGCNISIECPPEVPDTKGNCTCDGCYLPDPNDCSAFYFCDKGQLSKSYCPFGTLFSKISSTCENEDDVDCESNGDPSMCPEPYGFFPYPGDCKKFIHCDNSVAHVKKCQDDLEYDPLHRVCTKPRGYCGDIVPDPHCLEPTGMFPDPTDCSLFYHCEHGVAYPKRCSSPLMFNPDKKVCDWPKNVDCGKDAQSTSTTTVSPVPSKTTVNFSTTSTSTSPSKTTVNISTTMSTTPAPPVAECQVVPGVVCPCACRVPTYDECSSYYQCQEDGTACKKFCPEGLFFNKIEMVCDLPENVACRDFFFTSIRRAKLFSHHLK